MSRERQKVTPCVYFDLLKKRYYTIETAQLTNLNANIYLFKRLATEGIGNAPLNLLQYLALRSAKRDNLEVLPFLSFF